MVEYSKINCKLTNVQLNKLKKAVKSNEGATLRLGIKNFNTDELPHALLLTTRQNTKLRNAINNNLATDIKLSKAQIKKLIQSGGFLGKLLSKSAGPLMKVALLLAKNVLAPLGLTAATSAIDGSIQKKIHGSGVKLIIEQEYENTGTHWVSLFVKTKYAVYFDSFGLEHIPKEINTFIHNDIKSNIFRIQAYDSIMCGYFCIEFINYMLKSKTLLDYTNLFSPNDFKKNDQVIKRIFKNE